MRIGVLGNEDSWYVRAICEAALQHGHVPHPLQFPALTMRLMSNSVDVCADGLSLSSLDVLIVRTMPPGSLEQVVSRMDMLATVAANGVRIINSPRAIETAVDKALTLQKLVQAGIRIPRTIVCENSEAALAAFAELSRDVVVKPLFGAEGRGIMRVTHEELALRTFRTLERLNSVIYLQEFLVEHPGDIRILLLDGRVIGSLLRRPAAGDFRANAAQAGTSTAYEPTEAEVDLARRAAAATGCVFAGVDLMQTATGESVVIEVNAVPGWRALEKTTGVNVLNELFHWLAADSAACGESQAAD